MNMTIKGLSDGRRNRPHLLMLSLAAGLAFGLTAPALADAGAVTPKPETAETPAPLAVFSALHPNVGWEPWITDGTREGTRLLRNIGGRDDRGRSRSSSPQYFTDLGDGRVIFTATMPRRNWPSPFVTDGTRAGTQLVRPIESTGGYSPRAYTPLGDGRVLFITRNANSRASLWVTDTTRQGTVQIRAWGANDFPLRLTSMGDGRALFTGEFFQTDWRRQLWITDGTRGGTRVLARIHPDASADPNHFAALGDGRMLFSATDGVHGRELWITDGTEAGTRMVRDIRPGAVGSNPEGITPIGGGRAIFSAANPERQLYVTDGTEAGTRLVRDLPLGPEGFAPLGDGTFLFSAFTSGEGRELWRTDGTRAGTRLVQNINRNTSSDPSHITPLGDGRAVFWVFRDPRSGSHALWVSDGTRQGTSRVQQFPNVFHRRHHLTTLGDGKAVFTYNNGRTGWEPWVTDGTRPGTHLLRNIHRTGQSDPRDYTAFTPAPPGEPLAAAD